MGKASPAGAADTAYPVAEAIAKKVAFVSGASFFADGAGPNTFHRELFDCQAGAYRGGDAPPWRHAEPEGLMAVATRQEWQDDGDGDQNDDNPLQYLHTSSGGLIGHFFINAL
jgi:hypothetical protein